MYRLADYESWAHMKSGAVPLGRHKIIDNKAMVNNNISTFHDKLIDNFYQDII